MCVCTPSRNRKYISPQSAGGEVIPRYRYRYGRIDIDRCVCVCIASHNKKKTLRQSADREVTPIYRYRYRYRYRKIDTDRCVCALPAATENIFHHKTRVAR